MTFDEGVIKYHGEWEIAEPFPEAPLKSLMQWRDRLYDLGLIGAYNNGIGFGNASQRLDNSLEFVISGTQTGHLPRLTAEYYTRVTHFDLAGNTLVCRGPVKASSESLTHAAIYSVRPQVGAVLHVHHSQFWQSLLDRIPTTRPEIPYGTPQMAEEMFRLFDEEGLDEAKILVMAGHEDGVLAFGTDLDEAGAVLLQSFRDTVGG
ncbi:MAG: class II aldolase/adducin family protein [Cyanobacteria bacterium SID2]|nr:class II aldolase/adducin family protein [Cyanobacteria bacterium SID2]MBP0003968.1 class II aldolase/adducin family protein [Cyanobacteria bacterium SBC]